MVELTLTPSPGQTRTFIGSSSEGLRIAEAIKASLIGHTDCKVWEEDIFLPGLAFIETLEKVLDDMDYAILVATPDDMLRKRDIEEFSMRDNVLFELGLFMARLGRRRTYLVTPSDTPIHLPSDLLGVQTVTYQLPRQPGDLQQALAKPCQTIAVAMQEAQRELSTAARRSLVCRLLAWTTKLQGFVIDAQADSMRSILDRTSFERLREEASARVREAFSEHEAEAEILGVASQYHQAVSTVLRAIETIPFPDEAVVSRGDVIEGVVGGLLSGRSPEMEIRKRIDSLVSRYDSWWSTCGPQISRDLNGLQSALIKAM